MFSGFVIGLSGTLGAGKTRFVKNLLKTVAVEFERQVQSPTFNICHVYSAGDHIVHHYDLYRLESVDELNEIDIWESINSPRILTCIEWVDKFPELVEKCDAILAITICENGERDYTMKNS